MKNDPDMKELAKAARFDTGKPADVEWYVKETEESNPDYDESQLWATAWSRYCKYKNPGSEHCHMNTNDYFKNAMESLNKMAARSLSDIADEIRSDWKKVYFGALPYLEAMEDLRSIEDDYGQDSGSSIVTYFLSNASGWKGETAKRVKKELQDMLKKSRKYANDPDMMNLVTACGGIMAEGCPENLDEAACGEWEANTEKYKDVVKDKHQAGVPEKHQLRILIDTVKNPMKGKFLGGPSAEEAEATLKKDFKYTDKQIANLKKAGQVNDTTKSEPDNSMRKNPLDPMATWEEGEIDLKDDPRDHESEGSMIPGLEDRLAAASKEAMDFASPEALKKYLHDHPDANKSKHHVKKKDEGGGKSDDDDGDAKSVNMSRDDYKAVSNALAGFGESGSWGHVVTYANSGKPMEPKHVKKVLADINAYLSNWSGIAARNGWNSQDKKNLEHAESIMENSMMKKSSSDPMLAELHMLAEGCPDNLDEAECKEWESNTEKYKDVVKDKHQAADDDDAGDEKEGKFEKGKPADPTKDMSPEDAAEWRKQNDEHKDNFKSAGLNGYIAFFRGKQIEVEAKSSYEAQQIAAKKFGARRESDVTVMLAEKGGHQVKHDPMFASLESQWMTKAAADASGLYGYTRAIQSSCEASIRRMAKVATQLAKEAYRKDENVAPFLAAHAKRGSSLSAKILVAAMKTIGPKVASEMRKAELKADMLPADHLTKQATTEYGNGEKSVTEGYRLAARKYGLYGYAAKTASLGLQACTTMRETAGHVASEMHGRKAVSHGDITGFLSSHAKEAKCMYSKMLCASYPDADRKTASAIAPTTVGEWLSWED